MLIHSGNGLYYTTLILNESDVHQYRFVNGNTSAGFEVVPEACGFAGTTGELERQLVIPGNDTILSPVCFSSCEPCVTFQVSLAVDMIFQNVSVFGVHLAGSFNNWETGDLQMGSSGSALYQTELTVNAGDTIYYRFVNGITPADMEIVPTACGSLYNGTDYARALIVLSDTAVEAPCFTWCDPCDVGITDLEPAPFLVTLYPVPADDHITLMLTAQYSGKMVVNIFDLTGKALQSTEFPIDGGIQSYDLGTSSLPKGIYIARYLFQSSDAEYSGSVKLMINR
jgi:hypothetical protein